MSEGSPRSNDGPPPQPFSWVRPDAAAEGTTTTTTTADAATTNGLVVPSDSPKQEDSSDKGSPISIRRPLNLRKRSAVFTAAELGAATMEEEERAERLVDILASTRILPDASWKRIWDTGVLVITAYWCAVVPFAIIDPYARLALVHVCCEIPIGLLMAVDIFISFHTAIVVDEEVVADQRAITLSYLRGWFTPDLLSAIPLDTILFFAGITGWLYAASRCLRLLRLLKAPRLFLLSNPGAMTASYVSFYFRMVPIMVFCFWSLVGLHFLICFRLALADREVEVPFEYMDSLFWVWNLLTSSSGNLVVVTRVQQIFALACMSLSIVLQSVIVGEIFFLLAKSNIQNRAREKMRQTLDILTHYSIPEYLAQEVLSFQYHSLRHDPGANYSDVIGSLPVMMQQEINLYVKLNMINQVPMLGIAPEHCKVELAQLLKQEIVEPEVEIITEGAEALAMYFMFYGFADVLRVVPGQSQLEVVSTLKKGSFFGETALLSQMSDGDEPSSAAARRTATVRSLTYCDLFRLDKDDFQMVVSLYPEFKRQLQGRSEVQRRTSTMRHVPSFTTTRDISDQVFAASSFRRIPTFSSQRSSTSSKALFRVQRPTPSTVHSPPPGYISQASSAASLLPSRNHASDSVRVNTFAALSGSPGCLSYPSFEQLLHTNNNPLSAKASKAPNRPRRESQTDNDIDAIDWFTSSRPATVIATAALETSSPTIIPPAIAERRRSSLQDAEPFSAVLHHAEGSPRQGRRRSHSATQHAPQPVPALTHQEAPREPCDERRRATSRLDGRLSTATERRRSSSHVACGDTNDDTMLRTILQRMDRHDARLESVTTLVEQLTESADRQSRHMRQVERALVELDSRMDQRLSAMYGNVRTLQSNVAALGVTRKPQSSSLFAAMETTALFP